MLRALTILALLMVSPAVAQTPLQWSDPQIQPYWSDLERLAGHSRDLVFYDFKSDYVTVQVAWSRQLCGRNYCLMRMIEDGEVVSKQPVCNVRSSYRLEGRFFHHCEYEYYLAPGD